MADFNSGLGLTNDNSGAPPTDTGTPPPSDSGTPPPSSGGFNWQQYLPTNMGGTGTGATAMAIPALATAYNQYQNADRYMNMVNGTRGVLDPFGTNVLSMLLNSPMLLPIRLSTLVLFLATKRPSNWVLGL